MDGCVGTWIDRAITADVGREAEGTNVLEVFFLWKEFTETNRLLLRVCGFFTGRSCDNKQVIQS
jgi:hypothetical protein